MVWSVFRNQSVGFRIKLTSNYAGLRVLDDVNMLRRNFYIGLRLQPYRVRL